MSSCQEERTAAYGADLRWRMVWQREGLGFTLKQVASHLNVDKSTVQRTISTFRHSGLVSKKIYPTGDDIKPKILLSESVQLYILHNIKKPSIYLWELQSEIYSSLQIDISVSSLCHFLKKNNFSRQKMRIVASQRNEDMFLMFQFMSHICWSS